MSIVPTNDKVVVQAQISPVDVSTIHRGQLVHIRIASVGAKQLPVLQGTLEYVSADRLTTEQRPGLVATAAMPIQVPNAFYTARVTIERDELAKLKDMKLHAGMPVEVLINRGERTVLHYVVGPLSDNFARAFKEK
jgi:multidrug efflux pump subunit AcrA (membrane-fusion protein)